MIYYYSSPFGTVQIEYNNNYITALSFSMQNNISDTKTPLIHELLAQLDAYFQGKLRNFDIPYKFKGTEFQEKVWQELTRIPYGETRSYKEIAVAIGNAKGARAIGMANNKNPIGIIIPCHRVIGASGKLVGYAGGLDIKEKLLNLENSL